MVILVSAVGSVVPIAIRHAPISPASIVLKCAVSSVTSSTSWRMDTIARFPGIAQIVVSGMNREICTGMPAMLRAVNASGVPNRNSLDRSARFIFAIRVEVDGESTNDVTGAPVVSPC